MHEVPFTHDMLMVFAGNVPVNTVCLIKAGGLKMVNGKDKSKVSDKQ